MVVSDLEGTMTTDISALYYAKSAGKLADAKRVFDHLLEEDKRISCEAKTIDEFIKMKEKSLKLHLEEGARLLEGSPSSILNVQLKPSKFYPKIFELGKRDKNLSIVTCTDERTAARFFEGQNIPYNIAASSKLKTDSSGLLTGEFERYCGGTAKANAYQGREDVVVDSNIDLPLCKKAIENGRRVYAVNNGSSIEETFITNLEKFVIDYSHLS